MSTFVNRYFLRSVMEQSIAYKVIVMLILNLEAPSTTASEVLF